MTLPINGPISLGNLKTEFGGNASPKLSDYYKNGPFNKNYLSPIPESGSINLNMFYGLSKYLDTVFKSSGGLVVYKGVPGDKIVFPSGIIQNVTNYNPVFISGSTTAGTFTIIHSPTAALHGAVLAGDGLIEIVNITDTPNVNGLIGVVSVPNPQSPGNFTYYGRPNLRKVPSYLPNNITNLMGFFNGSTSIETNITGWDVSNVTNMVGMFSGAASFNQNITVWNVSNVTEMSSMFSGAASFNQNITVWNVSNVTYMNSMFMNATAFNQPIGSWSVGNVVGMGYMFYNATAFNQYLGGWCVSKIPTEPFAFAYGATKLLSSNKPKWGTCKVIQNV